MPGRAKPPGNLDPPVPASWRSLGFPLARPGRRLRIRIDGAASTVDASLDIGDLMVLCIGGTPHRLSREKPLRAAGPAAPQARAAAHRRQLQR
jgi:hypothetical protein